jgi:hypothetical protein
MLWRNNPFSLVCTCWLPTPSCNCKKIWSFSFQPGVVSCHYVCQTYHRWAGNFAFFLGVDLAAFGILCPGCNSLGLICLGLSLIWSWFRMLKETFLDQRVLLTDWRFCRSVTYMLKESVIGAEYIINTLSILQYRRLLVLILSTLFVEMQHL